MSARCPVCEGVDAPGLLHNPDAEYCSEALKFGPHEGGWTHCPICGLHESAGCECHLEQLAETQKTAGTFSCPQSGADT